MAGRSVLRSPRIKRPIGGQKNISERIAAEKNAKMNAMAEQREFQRKVGLIADGMKTMKLPEMLEKLQAIAGNGSIGPSHPGKALSLKDALSIGAPSPSTLQQVRIFLAEMRVSGYI